MNDFRYAALHSNMQVIYALHHKNKRKVIETFIDFMPYKSLKLFSYSILFKRKITEYEIACLKSIDEADKKAGFDTSRFNRRFWCHSYKTLQQLIEDERSVKIDEEMIAQISDRLRPYFRQLHKGQVQLFEH